MSCQISSHQLVASFILFGFNPHLVWKRTWYRVLIRGKSSQLKKGDLQSFVFTVKKLNTEQIVNSRIIACSPPALAARPLPLPHYTQKPMHYSIDSIMTIFRKASNGEISVQNMDALKQNVCSNDSNCIVSVSIQVNWEKCEFVLFEIVGVQSRLYCLQ